MMFGALLNFETCGEIQITKSDPTKFLKQSEMCKK